MVSVGVLTVAELDEDDDGIRYFTACTTTESGSEVTLEIQLESEIRNNGDESFVLVARCGSQVVVPDHAPGCTFVWCPRHREVRDLRVYIEKASRGQGFGYLVVTFVKSFFFPFVSDANNSERGLLQLPLGGVRKALSITVLPVTTQAKRFYRKQGFQGFATCNKLVFQPARLQAMYAGHAGEYTFGIESRKVTEEREMSAVNVLELA